MEIRSHRPLVVPSAALPPSFLPPPQVWGLCGGELGKVPPLLRWVDDEHALLVCPDMTSGEGRGRKGAT